MNTSTCAVDCYRRILSVQSRALKRLDRSPTSWPAIVVRKFPDNPGPAGHCSDGRRQIVDLTLPRDLVVSDIQNEAAIEAIAEETVLAGCPAQCVELLGQRECRFARGAVGRRVQSFPAPFLLKPMISPKCALVDPLADTQTRDAATVTYRMGLHEDSDLSLLERGEP